MSFLQEYTKLGDMDPHLMLFIFLPTLIFESAFVMDVHTFRKTIGQTIVIAGPGLLLCSFLTSLMARYIFPYNWSWVTSLMFGTILSATDPVAVVALLKDLGLPQPMNPSCSCSSSLDPLFLMMHVFLSQVPQSSSGLSSRVNRCSMMEQRLFSSMCFSSK